MDKIRALIHERRSENNKNYDKTVEEWKEKIEISWVPYFDDIVKYLEDDIFQFIKWGEVKIHEKLMIYKGTLSKIIIIPYFYNYMDYTDKSVYFINEIDYGYHNVTSTTQHEICKNSIRDLERKLDAHFGAGFTFQINGVHVEAAIQTKFKKD